MPRRTTRSPVTVQPTMLPDTVPGCHELIHQLMQRLGVLQERLHLNSRNSSKPPSSDGPETPPRAPRAKSGKRLGGQPGHKGSFRAMHHELKAVPELNTVLRLITKRGDFWRARGMVSRGSSRSGWACRT